MTFSGAFITTLFTSQVTNLIFSMMIEVKKSDMEVKYEVGGPHKVGWHIVVTLGPPPK